jgi:uncharacterized RmlC-like cupin family protein
VYQAETHETAADFVYVISGEAAVDYGRREKTRGPGEIRGSSGMAKKPRKRGLETCSTFLPRHAIGSGSLR